MPLSRSVSRKMLHLRDIQLRGYEREDGLFDIEARLTDAKTFSWSNHDRDGIRAGEFVHDIRLRVTIDRDMTIVDCEAAMDDTPYSVCPGVAPSVKRLIGLTMRRGFVKAAMELLPGAEGCTHIRELLQPLATTAFQTMVTVNKDARGRAKGEPGTPGKGFSPRMVNSCYAYRENGPIVSRANPPTTESEG